MMALAALPASRAQETAARPVWHAWAIDGTALACLGLCAAVFAAWLILLPGRVSLAGVLYLLAMPLSAYYMGRAMLRLARAGPDLESNFATVFLAGSVACGLLLFGLRLALPLPMHWSCAAVAGVALISQPLVPPGGERPLAPAAAWCDVGVVLLSLAAATLWSQDVLRRIDYAAEPVVLPTSSDGFGHATMVACFTADDGPLALGCYDMSGLPLPPYHYASYVFPASWSAFSGEPAYHAVLLFWIPFGTLLTGLAAYGLVASWWGRGAGFCGFVAFMLLPDPSSYWFEAPFLSYHWLQQSTPGGTYGIAAAAPALLLVVRGCAQGRWVPTALGLLLGLSSALFRAHVFAVLMPMLVLWVTFCYSGLSWRRRALLTSALIVVGLALMAWARHSELFPGLFPDGSGAAPYLRYVVQEMPENRFKDPLWPFAAGEPPLKWPVRALVFVLGATFGVAVLLVPVLLLLAWKWRDSQALDLVPPLAIGIYLACVFALPAYTNSGASVDAITCELQHRPLVWAYFVVVSWTGGRLYSLFRVRFGTPSLAPWVLAPLSCGLLAVPLLQGPDLQWGKFAWSADAAKERMPAPRGQMECARFLRQQTEVADVIQDSKYDLDLVVTALAERRSYVANWIWVSAKVQVPGKIEYDRRVSQVEQIKAESSMAQLQELATATGIRWFILHPEDEVGWPEEFVSQPVFSSRGFRLYRLPSDP